MRVITLNLNGIRSAADKGFFNWLVRQRADLVCVQETRAQEHQRDVERHHPAGATTPISSMRRGRVTAASPSTAGANRIIGALGAGFEDMDAEGRYIQADFGRLSVVSLYLPSGSSGEERQAVKFSFPERFTERLKTMRRQRRDWIICGDLNIVHKEIDIRNWKGNQKNSGCLPEERAWLDRLFGPLGFVDAFRVADQRPE